jgi:HEAT repeat protein
MNQQQQQETSAPIRSSPALPASTEARNAPTDRNFEQAALSIWIREGRILRKAKKVQEIEELASWQNPAVLPILIRALSYRKKEVREAAADALVGFGEAGFQAVLPLVTTQSGHTRMMAAHCLGDFGDPRAVEPLLLALKKEEGERKRHIGLMVVLLIIMTTVGAAFIGGMAHSRNVSREFRLAAIEALGKIGDVRAVARLAQLARGRSKTTALAARRALELLCPQVEALAPEEADRLGPEAIPALAALLSHRDDTFVFTVLKMLEAVGDGRALPAVERLANDTTRFPRTEAQKLLPILVAREEAFQERTMLLRGSTDNATASEQLLRAAQSYNEANTAPEELLRAATSAEQADQNP